MRTIEEVLATYTIADKEGLADALIQREDEVVGMIHNAATQFGMMPAIVAEVIATIGIGTPPDDETRNLIRMNFITLMEDLQRQHREQHPDN